MLVSEYVDASFEDVCRVLRDCDLRALTAGAPPAGDEAWRPALRATFQTATSAAFEWAERPSETVPRTLRVVMVQSGVRPLTELICVAGSATEEAAAVRAFATAVAATVLARIRRSPRPTVGA